MIRGFHDLFMKRRMLMSQHKWPGDTEGTDHVDGSELHLVVVVAPWL